MTSTWAERVVLYGVFTEPIFLFDWVRPGVFFHLPIADLSVEEQIEAFLSLQKKGFIVALDEKILRQNKDDPLPVIELTEPLIRSQFEMGWKISELRGPPLQPWHHILSEAEHRVSYRLTQQGGEYMEKLAKVDWNKFFDWSLHVLEEADLTENQEHGRGWLKSAMLETLENYIDWSLRWENNIAPDGMLTSLQYGRPIPIFDWKPLYWKTLSEGFMCSMDELCIHYSREDYTEAERRRWLLSNEERNQLFHWYTSPLQGK